jgi:DNA-binding CsgD family transcriptional regulator
VLALMATRSELRVLYRAILELPEQYREAIVLCGLQEKSYGDAAIILQCSEGTIASRMNRAKTILAAKLRRSGLCAATASTIEHPFRQLPGFSEGLQFLVGEPFKEILYLKPPRKPLFFFQPCKSAFNRCH